MMTVAEALKVLNLTSNFTKEELGKAYRNAVKKYHTDVNQSLEANEKIRIINVAHEVLKKELKSRPMKNSYKAENLSVFKKEALRSMLNMTDIDWEIKLFNYPTSWTNYINEMYEIYELYGYKIKFCETKEEIIKHKDAFKKEFYCHMTSFAKQFFLENPHLETHIEKTFETINEQLSFYKSLIDKYQSNWQKRVISLVENTIEYQLAKKLLIFDTCSLNNFICSRLKKIEQMQNC